MPTNKVTVWEKLNTLKEELDTFHHTVGYYPSSGSASTFKLDKIEAQYLILHYLSLDPALETHLAAYEELLMPVISKLYGKLIEDGVMDKGQILKAAQQYSDQKRHEAIGKPLEIRRELEDRAESFSKLVDKQDYTGIAENLFYVHFYPIVHQLTPGGNPLANH